MNGKILDIVQTFDKKFRVTFEVDAVDEINGLEGNVSINVKRVRGKRSLNANAYFHLNQNCLNLQLVGNTDRFDLKGTER